MEIDLSGLKDGNVAGFGVFEFPYAYVAVQQEGDVRKVVMCNDGKIVETAVNNLTQNKIWIKTRVTDKDFTASVFITAWMESTFSPVGDVLKMGLGLPWTANRFALFNFTTREAGVDGIAEFQLVPV